MFAAAKSPIQGANRMLARYSMLPPALAAGLLALGAGCHSHVELPPVSSKQYLDTVSDFNVGLAALQVGDDITADKTLSAMTRLAPGEPAGWANWGVLAVRQRSFDAARQRVDRALALAPQDDRLYGLLGVLESKAGRSAEAIAAFRKAAAINPRDLRAAYSLAQEIERQGNQGSDADVAQLMDGILARQPDNLAALLESSRIAAKRGDARALDAALARVKSQTSTWPQEVRAQFEQLQTMVAAGDLRGAGARISILRNALMRVPEYRQDRSAIKASPGEEAQPFTQFLLLASPVVEPAPADIALAFDLKPVATLSGSRWNWIGAIQMGATGAPVLAVANGTELRLSTGASLPYPGGPSRTPPTPEGVLQIDFNYDFKTDLVLAGDAGVRLFRQESPSAFVEVTAQTRLPRAVLNAHYTGAWAVDIEADGDLDIVLGSPAGEPVVLRNNGDGTFTDIRPFPGVSGVRQFAWADIDGDGNPDAAILDGSGRLHVFINERQGQFRERQLPAAIADIAAIAVAYVDGDGGVALLAVQSDGSIVRISDKSDGQDWAVATIAQVPKPSDFLAQEVRLRVADLDNNGALDLYLSHVASAPGATAGSLLWLGEQHGEFHLLDNPIGSARAYEAADLSGSGRLDLLALSDDGQALDGSNRGAKNYHWQIIRPHAAQAFGDQRINPFGVGGEVEIRAGLLLQKQLIVGPQVHFGLGEQTGTDVVRVFWPNGSVRAEFAVKADQEIETEQRLKGSCPFFFTFNGTEMEFPKDGVPWSSAIGLRINTLGSADIVATEEWYKIRGDQLVAHDGYYDLRITAEMWEVYYYDYLALMTVDHPVGTDIFVDERFVIPPAPLAITTVATPHDIVSAVDDTGQDVTEIVKTLDGRGLNNFGRGQYQGVTRDHYVEVDLGPEVPQEGPVYLLAHGSVYPTDSSINVAITQGQRWRAHGLSLEVPDGRGGWVVARDNLGFPAGRKKTILIDLTRVFRPGTPHRVRLRTNLEIFWDQIQWARGLPATALHTVRLAPTLADLHYRGYSVITRPDPGSPELPDYRLISGTKQRWRDLIGYYTRFGDVRELLAQVDDRYVIMNSGDEMSLRFAEQPPPAAGWMRDFVVVGDGWIKDGDYNSDFSKTVLPLPYHAKREYHTPPGRLEDEWVYRQHPEDWENYHTRYVTPDEFKGALGARAGP
jgi:tetratricopeptide (TPR) repeat protein